MGREFLRDVEEWVRIATDHLRPGLNGKCVKCGQGAEVWDRNLAACRKHAKIAGFAEEVLISAGIAISPPRMKRSGSKAAGGASHSRGLSASSPRKQSKSAIPGQLFDG